ncbi:sensor histidine kinase [Paenibacillus residui]|uniref:histidine kinase n=1 Tax=Paenibacillus residui TaxID=629724 RepID=A0ABW3DB09_9BACL
MSIRLRLTLWYSGVLLLTLLILGIGLYSSLHYVYFGDVRRGVKAQAEDIYSRIKPDIYVSSRGLYINLQLDESDLRNNNILLQFNDLESKNVTRNPPLVKTDIQFTVSQEAIQAAHERRGYFEQARYRGVDLLIYNHPVLLEGGPVAILQVGHVIVNDLRLFSTLRYTLIFIGLITVALAGTIGWFLSRKALKPIDSVIAAADQIQIGEDLSKRISYDGPNDEIGRLTETINGMLGRLQVAYTELDEAYRAQRRFVSDASHELRTPLTTIRGNVDLLEKVWAQLGQPSMDDERNVQLSLEAMRDIADEASRMSRLVNNLLSLARADAGYVMEKKELALQPLVEEVSRKANLFPRQAQWRMGDLSAMDGVIVRGNADYLQQLLFIFIENAFKYTPEGVVTIDAVASEDAGQIGIRISDTGIGMDKDEVPYIFERFYRADVSRGKTQGTGLGLSIAKWIIDEHEGSIEVTTRKEEGTQFVIWLPIVSREQD